MFTEAEADADAATDKFTHVLTHLSSRHSVLKGREMPPGIVT